MKKPHPLMESMQTERFTIVPLTRLQAFRLSYDTWRHDTEIMGNLFNDPKPMRALRWFRKRVWANGRTKFSHSICLKDGGKPVGMQITTLSSYRTASLTVVIHDRDWWGKKVVSEVRRRLIDHIFETRTADRVTGQVAARNAPSIFNYRRLGFNHVGTLHRNRIDAASGLPTDTLIFELLHEDWAAQRVSV